MNDSTESPRMSRIFSRREFVLTAGASLAAAACSVKPGTPATSRLERSIPTPDPSMRTVLFQGDSITDAGRDRKIASPNVGSALGDGYPLIIASALLDAEPDHGWRFFNRGVSGNKVPDLDARWQDDTIALAPDLVSILVGVNDYWHKRLNGYTGTVADYEAQYSALLARTRAALPSVRLVVLEPFVLRVGAVDETWFPEIDDRRAVAARVAQRARATWVPLQDRFTAAAAKTGPAYWLGDGVHPTPAGHGLIADAWRAAMNL